MTKKMVFALLLLVPLTVVAGWEYYVLNDQGEWEQISPRELDLTVPAAEGVVSGDGRRVMIIYDRTVDREAAPRYRNWVPQVRGDLVEAVE